MSIEIREVRPEETAEAGRITAEAYREYAPQLDPAVHFEDYLGVIADVAGRSGRTTVLIAVEGGDILGTVTLEIDARVEPDDKPPAHDELHIRMLGTVPRARGRGVGRRLVEASLELARARGRRRVTLHTTDLMTVAQHLYDTMGFVRQEGTRTMPYGVCLYAYTLILDGAPA